MPVGWISPTGVAAPWFADPHGWGPFRTFFGGLLTTCGLEHTLGPTDDTRDALQLPRPAHALVPAARPPVGDAGAAAGLRHRLGRARAGGVRARRGAPGQRLRRGADAGARDPRAARQAHASRCATRVRNEGYAPTPHMILYHVNAGWPLVGQERARSTGLLGEPRFASPPGAGRGLAGRRRADARRGRAGLGARAASRPPTARAAPRSSTRTSATGAPSGWRSPSASTPCRACSSGG